MTSIGVLLLLQVFLIALNAVFACTEIAVISVNDNKMARMAAQGDKRAQRLVALTEKPASFLATIQVAITLSGFLGSAFAAENFSDTLVNGLIALGVSIPASTLDTMAVVVITIVLSYFTLVFGELLPKQLAMRKAEAVALALSGPITFISKVFAPPVSLLTLSTNGLLRLLGFDPNASDDEMGEEEIRMMVDVGSEKGVIDPEEKEFIQNVFEFDDLTADEIATHRTDVILLWLEESDEEWDKIIRNCRHSLIPVCGNSSDHIVGILHAKEYFRLEDKSRESVMTHAIKPAYFVPESVKADVLFRNMKQTHNKIAVVLDEYGGMTGIITIVDLVEQLVGDLVYDDPNHSHKDVEAIDSNTWRIHGDADLEEVSKALGLKLPCRECETFNGFVFDAMGSIPQDGKETELEVSGLSIRITDIRNHQIESAIVCRIDPVNF